MTYLLTKCNDNLLGVLRRLAALGSVGDLAVILKLLLLGRPTLREHSMITVTCWRIHQLDRQTEKLTD